MSHHDRVMVSLEGDVRSLQAQLRGGAAGDERQSAPIFRDLVSTCVQRGVARQRTKRRLQSGEEHDPTSGHAMT